MQIPMAVIDAIAFTKRIQTVSLSRMLLSGISQGIEYLAKIANRSGRIVKQGKLMIDKTDIKRRVMNDEFRVPDKPDQIPGNILKIRLAFQKEIGDSMHLNSPVINQALWIDIDMKAVAR